MFATFLSFLTDFVGISPHSPWGVREREHGFAVRKRGKGWLRDGFWTHKTRGFLDYALRAPLEMTAEATPSGEMTTHLIGSQLFETLPPAPLGHRLGKCKEQHLPQSPLAPFTMRSLISQSQTAHCAVWELFARPRKRKKPRGRRHPERSVAESNGSPYPMRESRSKCAPQVHVGDSSAQSNALRSQSLGMTWDARRPPLPEPSP